METYTISSGGTEASVAAFGAMVTASFTVGDRQIDPFYRAPWLEKFPNDAFLNHLQGDFLCAPFGGTPAAAEGFSKPWYALVKNAEADAFAHGYPAHHAWEVQKQTDSSLQLGTANLPFFSSIIRQVSCNADGVLEVKDCLTPTDDFSMPVGLHPIFGLSEQGSALKLPDCDGLYTFPGPVDTSSVFAHYACAERAEAIPGLAGEYYDVTALPLPIHTEELLMLTNVKEGKVSLQNRAEGYQVTLEWNATVLPNCLLWFSNRGRQTAPWNGRNLCLGIEPIAAAFDLGQDISIHKNPLSETGVRTAMHFCRKEPVVICHQISVTGLV